MPESVTMLTDECLRLWQAQARRDDAAADAIRTKYEYIFRIKILEFYFGLPIVLN